MLPLAEQNLSFLIVEDSSFFRSALSSMLSNIGCNTLDMAHNANQAIEACKSRHYSIILCDFDLGKGKNGHQLLEALRHYKLIPKHCLFMMITADTSRQAVLASSEYAADDYLTKPINAVILERRLMRLTATQHTFKPVMQALENNDTELAVSLLERLSQPKNRLAKHAQKLLGDVLLQAQRFDEAHIYFQCILDENPAQWAQLGQANAWVSQGLLGPATQTFNEVLADNPLCLSAYDGLANIYHEQKDFANLQKAITSAVKASPLSILRQKNLANIAEENGDIPTAIEALRECVRLGMNSCFGEWEDAYRLGMKTADAPKALLEKKDMLPQDALKALKAATQYFDVSPEALLRMQFVQGRLQYLSHQHFDAQQTIEKTEQQYQTHEKPDVQVDVARIKAIRTLNKSQQAKTLTQNLAKQYAEDESALKQLDEVLDEPLSQANKRVLAKANKEGIALYNKKQYDEAVLCFQRAQVLFPRHLGLQMNICQAYIGKHNRGDAGELDEIISDQLANIRDQINPQNAQYARYKKLQSMAQL